MAKYQLTELQNNFVEALFNEAEGDVRLAKKLAGYSPNARLDAIICGDVRDAIIEKAKYLLALHAPKAALGLIGLVDDPTALGSKVKLQAVKEILDRVNIVKTDQVQIETEGGIFFLPNKDN